AGAICGSNHIVELSSRAFLALAANILGRPKLAAVPLLARTSLGAYFLGRCLFLPHELADVMGADAAEEGLARLNSTEESSDELQHVQRQGWAGYVAALESTRYLRTQLLRDADWASMAHSLELRTPLADHVLTRALAPYAHQLVGGVGKSCLARAPIRALPLQVANASKTGFGLPIG